MFLNSIQIHTVSMNTEEAIERTGKLLLSGWKMLAISCPICNSVLLSKDNNMQCPGCNLPVMSESKLIESNIKYSYSNIIDNNVLPEHNDSNSSAACDKSDDLVPDIPKSWDEMKNEYDIKNKERDIISNKIGQKLLLGWIMLGDVCTNVNCRGSPLMKEKDSDVLLCVACASTYIINQFGELELQSKDNKIVSSDEIAVESKSNVINEQSSNYKTLSYDKETESDKISKLISSKLLLGYVMLDAVCGLCTGTVPLLRDKNNQEYCVICGIRNTEVITKDVIKANDSLDEFEDDYVEVKSIGTKINSKDIKLNNDSVNTPNDMTDVKAVLHQKLLKVTEELKFTKDISKCLNQVNLIKSLIETIKIIE